MTTKQKRYLFFWLQILVANIVPLLILGFKYHLFASETSTVTKWSFWLTLGIVFLVFRLFDALRNFIIDMDYGWARSIILGIMQVMPWILLILSVVLINIFTEQYTFIVLVITLCGIAGAPLSIAHDKYRTQSLKERGDVRVIR